jgi:GNAT superfamily N-acetyltransferase
MVLVRTTTLADWQALRDIRLQALRDAPDAFGSTYARESAFGESVWHQRATRDGSFLAFIPEASSSGAAGLAGGFREAAGVVELVSMFVRPQARGRGVGEALIGAVVGWARARNATSVHLWVTETNKPARRLYERCGFTAAGERQPLPSNPSLGEIGMTRLLEYLAANEPDTQDH